MQPPKEVVSPAPVAPNESDAAKEVNSSLTLLTAKEIEKDQTTILPKENQKLMSNGKPALPTVPSIWNPKSARFQLNLLLFGVFLANMLIQNTMSMGLVCMINSTYMDQQKKPTNHTNATGCANSEDEDVQYEGPLLWDSRQKGIAISAIYWGGLFTAIPAGYFADRRRPKIVLTACLILGIVGCLLTPVTAIRGGLIAVSALRFIMGFGGQATIMSTVPSMCSRWIPPFERSTSLALYTAGTQIGMMISGPFNAFLCQQTHVFGGWPGIFYFTGIIVVPILIFWILFAADRPEKYKWIAKTELEYIQTSLAEQHLRKKKVKCKHIPYRKMFRSVPLQAAYFSNFTLMIMATSLQSYIPTYFKQSLKLNLNQNGFLSALPFLSQWIVKIIVSPIADRMRSSKILGSTWICKICNSIGTFGTSIFLMATAYMTCDEKTAAVAFLTLTCGIYSFQFPGFITSLVFIAPAFTGIVNSFGRFYGQIGSVISPLIVGAMTQEGTSYQWLTVFWLMSSVTTFSGILFLIFGSADIQDWAKPKKSKDNSDDDPDSISCRWCPFF